MLLSEMKFRTEINKILAFARVRPKFRRLSWACYARNNRITKTILLLLGNRTTLAFMASWTWLMKTGPREAGWYHVQKTQFLLFQEIQTPLSFKFTSFVNWNFLCWIRDSNPDAARSSSSLRPKSVTCNARNISLFLRLRESQASVSIIVSATA